MPEDEASFLASVPGAFPVGIVPVFEASLPVDRALDAFVWSEIWALFALIARVIPVDGPERRRSLIVKNHGMRKDVVVLRLHIGAKQLDVRIAEQFGPVPMASTELTWHK